MKIRTDLAGVVTAYDAEGTQYTLMAGDEVPDGVEIGDHVTEAGDEVPDGVKAVRRRTGK